MDRNEWMSSFFRKQRSVVVGLASQPSNEASGRTLVQSITDQFTEHEHPLKRILTLFGIERKGVSININTNNIGGGVGAT